MVIVSTGTEIISVISIHVPVILRSHSGTLFLGRDIWLVLKENKGICVATGKLDYFMFK